MQGFWKIFKSFVIAGLCGFVNVIVEKDLKNVIYTIMQEKEQNHTRFQIVMNCRRITEDQRLCAAHFPQGILVYFFG